MDQYVLVAVMLSAPATLHDGDEYLLAAGKHRLVPYFGLNDRRFESLKPEPGSPQ